ncbi:MAG: translation elongation factor Ts [Planctomycetes bacterium]|nr:translation elongation factor Ts [Planctomycetota bacterium]
MGISAAMVKALRDRTGLPMMDCKKALTEASGDEAQAIELLRRAGLGQVSKRSERTTTEGRVACYADPETGRTGIVELRCETSPVANTDDFINLAALLARTAAKADDPTPDSLPRLPNPDNPATPVSAAMETALNRLRENIQIARVGCCSGHVGHYVHHNSQVAVVVKMNDACPDELKADICMHIAAMNPPYLRREDVDPADVEKERELAAESAQGKPENIVEKIVTGKLNRWYADIVLLEQPFVKDDKKSVGETLLAAAPHLTVDKFLRFEVGGA